ncbi:DUF1631 family protein [Ideonella sp.]|uniref:DUF1631 family protein n=1 Tax=Ideonella sp. TaxID=1929293 RepID=UPI002B4876AA|nr:DUF1631 family protein [Ideonella sp.]HJV71835.1 DUF1631 family protein [Ideonella sp.]
MPASSAQTSLLDQARLYFAERLVKEFQPWLDAALAGAQALNEKPAERTIAQQRRDMLQELMRHGSKWPGQLADRVHRQMSAVSVAGAAAAASPDPFSISITGGGLDLKLVDDDTIQREILVSRLAQGMLDKGLWEFNDLRARLTALLRQPELGDEDLFRPPVLAECVIQAWTDAGLSLDTWRGLEEVLVKACAKPLEGVWKETNKWLIDRGVMPEVDLRGAIRRSDGTSTSPGKLGAPEPEPTRGGASTRFADTSVASAPMPPSGGRSSVYGSTGYGAGGAMGGGAGGAAASGPGAPGGGAGGGIAGGGAGSAAPVGGGAGPAGAPGQTFGGPQPPQSILHGHSVDDETRMMTRPVSGGGSARADFVLQHFSEVMERHLPGFRDTTNARPASARLSEAMAKAQQRLVEQAGGPAGDGAVAGGVGGAAAPTPEVLLQELRDRQTALKAAATTPAERATVELVALLFQAILTEERIPAQLRVWFARLQMPTLRVAIAEPDFFSTADHPARRLIDRMGACVMGFEGGAEVLGTPLEGEIKRVVQVVEAFPDTGRRVFQTVLNEFEKFLEGYFREQNEKSRAGVSLAQQVEQRETLAIQYTIELRKLLGDVPVHEGIREFLFHVWADVLATAAVRHGPHSPEVKTVRAAASELLWTASAKTNREDRAEVIRRLPPLLTTLRQGMASVGLAAEKQENAIKSLNLALTAAFSARATAISPQQLDELKERLEMLEELLPEEDVEIDESWVLDSSSHQQEGLEIVADGGSMPGPAMLQWAAELQLGAAFMLDWRGRQQSVRLVWQGMSRQLSLFSAADGRCVLFQKARLAAFLQAGLLVPLQDESLTVAATRNAIEKIKADPARLLA